MKSTRSAYNNSVIEVTTNGLLLPKMDDTFFESLRLYNINIGISKYPPTEKILDQCTEILKKNKISFTVYNQLQFYKILQFSPKSDEDKMFKLCPWKNCHILHKSKLYLCAVPLCIEIFNKYFNTQYESIEGVDIYNFSDKELNDHFTQPSKFCGYCNWSQKQIINWAKSSLTQEDWIIT